MNSDATFQGHISSPDIKMSSQQQGINRREFLRRAGCASVGFALALVPRPTFAQTGDSLPTRILGRTKEKVSILGLGTAPVGEGPVGVEEGIRIFSEAIDRGVTYVDTARIYGNAEEILGHIIPKRRDKLFVVSKVSTDNGTKAQQSLNTSLRQLKTDYLDLVHIHLVAFSVGLLLTVNTQMNVLLVCFQNMPGHEAGSRRAVDFEGRLSAQDPRREDEIGIPRRVVRVQMGEENRPDVCDLERFDAV